MNQDVANNLSKLLKVFNGDKIISSDDITEIMTLLVKVLAENKKGVESLNAETKEQVESAIRYISGEHDGFMKALEADVTKTKAEMEKATKAQNDRAFKRLQELISQIKMPRDGLDGAPGQDGAPGKDGSPDTAEQVRDKLESLKGEARLDAFAIKNLPKFIKEKGKEWLVGGVRFLEELADVSILPAKKRPDLTIQYNDTTKRWENGVALTVSLTAPSNPEVNDIWIDLN
jgi:hypothetical protein